MTHSASSARRLFGSPGTALLATAALCLAAAVLATWPLASNLGSATLGTGEVLLSAWQLNWFQHALLTDPLSWVDANIFFPYEGAAALNDLLLTHALVTLPAAWSPSPVLALNLALLGGIVLCGVFGHLLISELVDSPWAAMVGGTLFALSPFRFLHLTHLSIAAAWATPLFFWALLRHLRRPSWSAAILVALSGVAVGASSLYQVAFVLPVLPLVVLFGLRRGPGGQRTWVPLLAAGLPGLAVLGHLLYPYAMALQSFGVGSAPSDLLRYGADLSSLAQKPVYLGGAAPDAGIHAEAHLYPGGALALLACAGAIGAAAAGWAAAGWRRRSVGVLLALLALAALGVLLPLPAPLELAWRAVVLALIWIGPLAALAWAVVSITSAHARGPGAAIALGVAGTASSFVLALGPEARYLTERIGAAPYWLLAASSSAFEGTRAPARFGGLVILFLGLAAAGCVAGLLRGGVKRRRLGVALASIAVAACFAELPLPELPEGRALARLPELRDPAYGWIAERTAADASMLELPDWPSHATVDYEHRTWRALRYMLASKQHGRHLVNGSARIDPFLWKRFRKLEPWSDEFLAFITAYYPVDYVLVHDEGIPGDSRGAVRARLEQAATGWEEVFRSGETRVYTIDRSSGRGTFVDRLFLRREVAPQALVTFSARVAIETRPQEQSAFPAAASLELLVDDEPVAEWPLDSSWRSIRSEVTVGAVRPTKSGWPGSTARFSWRAKDGAALPFEIRNLTVRPAGGPARPTEAGGTYSASSSAVSR